MEKKFSKALVATLAAAMICGFAILVLAALSLRELASQRPTQYFLTVGEVLARESKLVERNIRISGVVLGNTIEYDEAAQSLSFTIANVPADYRTVEELGGLEKVLQEAATDPGNSRIKVEFVGPRPELLRGGAQAIMTGKVGSDGIFYADEILLRCPTRYEEAVPEQVK